MAFEKGKPRAPNAGRKAGVPNKSPPMKTIRDSLSSQGFDLGQELVNLYKSSKDDATKLKILQTLATYTQTIPKDEAPQDPLHQLSPEELDNLINELENPTGSTEDQATEATPSVLDGGKTELETTQCPIPHLQPNKATC